MPSRRLLIRFTLLVLIAACGGSEAASEPTTSARAEPTAGDEAEPAEPLDAEVAVAEPLAAEQARAPAPFRIATWNIENLSRNKLADTDRAAAIVAIVRDFDVVAIEELSDAQGLVGRAFLDAINAADPSEPYEASISPRSGREPANRMKQEHYGVHFRAAAFDVVSEQLYDDSARDAFVREPWITQLRHEASGSTFALVTIHAVPKNGPTAREIDALADVVTWVVNELGEPNVVVLGDFNAGVARGCRYVSSAALAGTRLRGDEYVWVVPDDGDTSVAASACAHDRVVLTRAMAGWFHGEWDVVDDAFTAEDELSDHWPVWLRVEP